MHIDYLQPRKIFDRACVGLWKQRRLTFAFPDAPPAIAIYDYDKVIELYGWYYKLSPSEAAYEVERQENQMLNRLGAPIIVNTGEPGPLEERLFQPVVDVSSESADDSTLAVVEPICDT